MFELDEPRYRPAGWYVRRQDHGEHLGKVMALIASLVPDRYGDALLQLCYQRTMSYRHGRHYLGWSVVLDALFGRVDVHVYEWGAGVRLGKSLGQVHVLVRWDRQHRPVKVDWWWSGRLPGGFRSGTWPPRR
jgi:hypothetical protein